MEHLAIDLGGRESQICVRSSEGQIIEEKRWPTKGLARYLAHRPPSRVILETCTEAFGIADAALTAGHEVRVVPGTMVRSLGVGSRRTKNDRRDAQILSEVSCRIDLPSVHVPSQKARERKSLCGAREALVEARTKLVNTVRAWLRREARQLRSGGIETFPKRVRQGVEEHPTYIERLLLGIEALSEQISEAEKELERLAKEDLMCQRLMTVPGVGPVTAVRFSAAVDDIARFSSAHQVQSYLGIVPGEDSSSERKRITGITKAGSRKMRWTLVQACWVARRRRPDDPMVRWSMEIERRRGKRIAVVALARKVAGILYAIWRDGSTYDPKRGATTPTSSPPIDLSQTIPLSKATRKHG